MIWVCPVGYTFEEAKQLLIDDKKSIPTSSKGIINSPCRCHQYLAASGMYFGIMATLSLKEAGEAGAKVER